VTLREGVGASYRNRIAFGGFQMSKCDYHGFGQTGGHGAKVAGRRAVERGRSPEKSPWT